MSGLSFGRLKDAPTFVLVYFQHAKACVATMGQHAASIAQEVNQPIAALHTNAATAARWLARANHKEVKARIAEVGSLTFLTMSAG